MINKKPILKGLTWAASAFVLIGFVLPYLFSMASNEAVFAGITIIVIYLLLIGNTIINLINKNKKQEDEKN